MYVLPVGKASDWPGGQCARMQINASEPAAAAACFIPFLAKALAESTT